MFPSRRITLRRCCPGIAGNNADRVPGVPLFTVPDLNCHCYDPANTFVLNPAVGAAASRAVLALPRLTTRITVTSARPARTRPLPARIFRIRERVSSGPGRMVQHIQSPGNATADFENALATQLRTATGTTQSGFGAIVTSAGEVTTGPRNGQILMKSNLLIRNAHASSKSG